MLILAYPIKTTLRYGYASGTNMGKRAWLDRWLTTEILPTIAAWPDSLQGRTAAQELTAALRDRWAERGFTTLSQQQGLMDQTRRTIKDQLGDEHFSLEAIRFSKQEYIQLNEQKQGRVSDRNEATQFLDDPDAIVAQAVRLLDSPEWAEVTAGLAVLTGRRSSELLSTATFAPCSHWSVTFTGSLKRRGEAHMLSFEIPTLATAERVCTALSKIRQALPVAQTLTAQQVNAKYAPAVIRACDRAFANLVPLRAGKDNLYTHLFRAIYGTISTFWYCPPRVNATEFKAAIQGHYGILDEENPELRRSLSASRHYSDYEIADRVIAQYNGQRQGIKLGYGGVQPIEVFKPAWRKESMTKTAAENVPLTRRHTTSVRLWQEDKERLQQLLDLIEASEGRQQDRLADLLTWVEKKLQPATKTKVKKAKAPLSPKQPQSTGVEQLQITPPVPTQLVEPEPKLASVAQARANQASAAQPQPAKIELPSPEESTPIETAPTAPPVPAELDPNVAAMLAGISQLTGQMGQLVQFLGQQETTPAGPGTGISAAASSQPGQLRAIANREQTAAPLRLRRSKTETDHILERAISAIMDWNDAPDRTHDLKWAITINALKAFVKSQAKIERTLQERRAEIAQHHAKHQIDPGKHNLRHRGKATIDQVIFL